MVYKGGYNPANTKYLYNVYTMLCQRRRRWVDVVYMLYKCFVFVGNFTPSPQIMDILCIHNVVNIVHYLEERLHLSAALSGEIITSVPVVISMFIILVHIFFSGGIIIGHSQTLCSGFHYATYIGISPHRTLAVV